MIVDALLLASVAVAPPACADRATLRSVDASPRTVRHVFQNGERMPLRLAWIDRQGKSVDLGTIAPGAHRSIDTVVGHVFRLTGEDGRCRHIVRADTVMTGSYLGTSRYRPAAVRRGWHVFVDQALDPAAEPARTALATLARMLDHAETALPAAAVAQVRGTPIFIHDHAGPGAMFHPDPDWLVKHGRTVELVDGIEVADAGVFVEIAANSPGAILHELAHAYYWRLPDDDRAAVDAAYRRAMAGGLYRSVKRWDGSVAPAYARTNAAEYFAELTETYFARNDFFPFTRAELATYDPVGEGLIARLWR